MKSQAMIPWALALVLLCVVMMPASSAIAGDVTATKASRDISNVKDVTGSVSDVVDIAGEPQYGDPDDLGDGEGKPLVTKPLPPIGDASGNEAQSSLSGYWSSFMSSITKWIQL